jgi:hypothetical protein
MRRSLITLCLSALLLAACGPVVIQVAPSPVQLQPSASFTAIPTLPPAAATPQPPNGSVALDFTALLCGAQWSNGAKHLTACTPVNADHSGGFAEAVDPVQEGFPVGTPVLLTIPAWNGASSLFLRYPSFLVHEGDRFRALVRCREGLPCDVQFALEYYDRIGDYHSPFLAWNLKSGDAPVNVDADLSALAAQKVDFVLVLRLFHALDTPQRDNGLWIAPQIYRTGQ